LVFPSRIFKKRSDSDKKLNSALRNLLGFYPSNLEFYKLAFRHSSVATLIKKGVKDSNERLEFLGDAILGAVIADYLYKRFPYQPEGFLTKMRSKLVSRSHINQLAMKLGVDIMIESNLEGRHNIQSIKGDALEALIGAVYLDKGYKPTANFILNRILKFHVDLDELEAKETDYKSRLIEWVQKEKRKLSFNIVSETGNSHQKIYTINVIVDDEVKGSGKGYSKKAAEQEASQKACEALGI